MADVDAKEVALKNLPMIVIYVVAVIPVFLWFALVGGGVKGATGARADSFDSKVRELNKAARKITSLEKKIKDPAEIVYTGQHLDQFKRVHEDYAKQIQALRQIVLEQDTELEKWFDGVALKKDGQPKPNDYIQLYRKKLKGLTKEYAAVVTPPEGGSPRVYATEPNAQQLKTFQKRFWIQKSLFAALQAGSKETREAGGPGAVLAQAPTFDSLTRGVGEESGTSPVERISVKTVFTCRFSDVPKILSHLLAQPVTFEVVSLAVEKAPFTIEDAEINLRVEGRATTFNESYYTGELKDHKDFKGDDKIHEYLPEPPVKVTLDLEVLDFTVEAAPPPPKEEEAGAEDDLGDTDDGSGS